MSDDAASRGGSALTEGLGPLPAPGKVLREPPAFYKDEWREHHFYTADQMRAYAAAAVVAELERTMQPWIPVTERLPEKFTEVLVAFAGQITLASTGQWTGSPHDHNGWCYPAENNGICDDGSDPVVTHWMPLPEVPEWPNVEVRR